MTGGRNASSYTACFENRDEDNLNLSPWVQNAALKNVNTVCWVWVFFSHGLLLSPAPVKCDHVKNKLSSKDEL